MRCPRRSPPEERTYNVQGEGLDSVQGEGTEVAQHMKAQERKAVQRQLRPVATCLAKVFVLWPVWPLPTNRCSFAVFPRRTLVRGDSHYLKTSPLKTAFLLQPLLPHWILV